jgi:hypothetical protein
MNNFKKSKRTQEVPVAPKKPAVVAKDKSNGIQLHTSDNYEFEGCACICITMKNVDPIHLAILDNLNLLKTWIHRSFFVFINCNSIDTTYENYKNYPNSIILNSQHEDMCKNRNMYLTFVLENKNTFDYMMVIDPYFSLWRPLNITSFNFLKLQDIEWNAMFANQSYKYYDIENLVTKDINITEVSQENKKQFIKDKQMHIPCNQEYITVDSAYGGFAVYKTQILHDTVKYTEDNHIGFNLSLFGSKSNMFIDPAFIIHTNPNNATVYL